MTIQSQFIIEPNNFSLLLIKYVKQVIGIVVFIVVVAIRISISNSFVILIASRWFRYGMYT